MSFIYERNGVRLNPTQGFTIGEGEDAVRYPPNWLTMVGPMQLAAIGVTTRPDDTPLALTLPSISPRQIRMALTRAGLRSAVEAAVTAGDQDLKDWWEFSTYFDRTHAQVTAMATALGVTDDQLDALWQMGATL